MHLDIWYNSKENIAEATASQNAAAAAV